MTTTRLASIRPFLILLAAGSLAFGCPEREPSSPAESDAPTEAKAPADAPAQDQPADAPEAEEPSEGAAAEHEAVPARRADPTAAPEDVAAPAEDDERTGTGLASKVLRPGTGNIHPSATSQVTVHYTGWTTDGRVFDSSITRGQPATFTLDRVIPGWTEGLQLMVVGEQRRFWIPEALAYGGRPGSPAGMLVFDVELLAIQ